MATFADLLSSTQKQNIVSLVNQKSDAEIYAPNTPACVHEAIYVFAGKLNCKLNSRFWAMLDDSHTSAVVCVSGKQVSVMPVMESVAFAKRLGEMLKAGNSLLWVLNADTICITWDNWRECYVRLAGTLKSDDGLPVPISRRETRNIRTAKNRERMFNEAASCNRYKKMGKRGFNMAFDQARAEWRAEQYDKYFREVVTEAREIIKML